MTVVVDASVVVAALLDTGPDGTWAESLLGGDLAAPHLPTGRGRERDAPSGRHASEITDDIASLAHGDLLDLRIELFPYDLVAPRAWELRHNLTSYDAWYVALAELLDAPLATLDRRIVGAPGPRCDFRTPDS